MDVVELLVLLIAVVVCMMLPGSGVPRLRTVMEFKLVVVQVPAVRPVDVQSAYPKTRMALDDTAEPV